jgi:muramoyltetrapeptide carboxypeptidase LdcA involved in peptidoglycan recycling
MLKPKMLRSGDKVAAVSLSSGEAARYPQRYKAGKHQLEKEFGVRVVEMKHALRDQEYLAKHPQARADDLMQAFCDSSIKGIFAISGGDDSIRLLPHTDLSVIRDNPKVFCGISDTTVTHFTCFQAGLTSFYGPAIMAGFAENGGLFPYLADSVRRTMFSSEPIGTVEPHHGGWANEDMDWESAEDQQKRRPLNSPEPWNWAQGKGTASGPLLGGCLEVVEMMRGTDIWPGLDAWRGAILFLETSDEMPPPVALLRALRSYARLGILDVISGIIVGRPAGPIPRKDFDEYDAAVMQAVVEEEGLDELPIVTRMDFGHTDPAFVLPLGVRAEINCDAQTFSILESAVQD